MMGVEEVISDGSSEQDELDMTLTVGDLVDMFGEGAVRRGIAYMSSLEEADREYREAANKRDLKQGYEDMGVTDDGDGSIDSVAEKWEEKMKGDGLGINE